MRERILRAAEEVFARDGYAGATTHEIARRAGIQKRMLFYYFQSKDQLYGLVLDGLLGGIRDIHSRFHGNPGALGLQDIVAGLIRFVAVNPNPVRILFREIMDNGPHLDRIVDSYIGPLFHHGMTETSRNMARGVFRSEDPMHPLINVGGLTVFYLLNTPLLERLWDRDPLAPDTLEERIEATTRFVLGGMLATGGKLSNGGRASTDAALGSA
jgi:AcrR family transcriptional regulator